MKISIVGATAYTSQELIHYLLRHPAAEIVHLGGRREGNPAISDIFPALRGRCDLPVRGLKPNEIQDKPDIAFFTLPHQVSHQYVPLYLEEDIRCIDFSADYRFQSRAVYETHYGSHGNANNLDRAVYGIPELFREKIAEAQLIANPGCYPTSVILGLGPLVKGEMINLSDIVVDAKSGVSGRGNKPSPGSMYCECNENFSPYKVGAHRHAPEMEQGVELLGEMEDSDVNVLFVPHLAPMDRGILSTIYVRLTGDGASDLQEVYREEYGEEHFVRVLPEGEFPSTKNVVRTNYCDIAVRVVEKNRAVITVAIDNLARGAASQAVQNMNASLRLEETLGIE